jgi:predicted ATPase
MLDRLKTGYVFQKKENSEIYIINTQNNAELRPIDVGVGISQILPVVVAALQTKNGFLAIEQPELHIHPALQVELGDLFLSCVQNSNVCLLIETHSEHLLLRIMRRIRETFERSEQSNMRHFTKGTDSTPDQVGVFYVEIDRGKTVAREMPLNVRGELVKSWPGGFFEEDLEEVL